LTIIRARAGRIACVLLASTSLCALAAPAKAQMPPPPLDKSVDDNGVDSMRGTLDGVGRTVDVSIGPEGTGGLSFERWWIGGTEGGGLGGTWAHNWAFVMEVDGDEGTSLNVVVGGGSERFTYSPPLSRFVPDRSGGGTLDVTGVDPQHPGGTGYIYTAHDGTVVVFEGGGVAWPYDVGTAVGTSVKYPDGTVAWIHYTRMDPGSGNVGGRIESVTNSHGYQLKFSYPSADPDGTEWPGNVPNRITAINNAVEYCDPGPASCSLAGAWPQVNYTLTRGWNTPWIATATDAANRTTSYSYDWSWGALTGIRRPGAAQDDVSISYEQTDRRVASITSAGVTQTYTYGGGTSSGVGPDSVSKSGPNPYTKTFSGLNPYLSVITSISEEVPVSFTYYIDMYNTGKVKTETYPKKIVTYEYDTRGNLTKTTVKSRYDSSQPTIVTSATYPATCTNPVTCNKPLTTTDARGYVIDYSYDPVHGGITSIKYPAGPNGVRPEVRTSYTGLKAYYKTSSGGSPVASAETHYLPTAVSACQTSASCAGGADEVKVQTSYGPQTAGTANNLLPVSISAGSGNGSLTATTAVTYDTVGNAIYKDGPLAGSADTSRTIYNAAREAIGAIGPDPDGTGPLKNRAQRVTLGPDGQPTKVEVGTTNGQGDSAWAAFQPLQQIDTQYDSYGRQVQVRNSGGGTTYGLIQTSYDPLGRPECQALRMNPSAWSALPSSACALGAEGTFGPDRITRVVRDSWGRPTTIQSAYGTTAQADEAASYSADNSQISYRRDGENNLTAYVYDDFGRLSKTYFPNPNKGANDSNGSDREELTYDNNGNVTQRAHA
jgi:hypothetical protein